MKKSRRPYIILHEVYSLGGLYIGTEHRARTLHRLMGITKFYPLRGEKVVPMETIAQVGWSPSRKRWFGWSHRAIAGFKTRRAAERFAERVS